MLKPVVVLVALSGLLLSCSADPGAPSSDGADSGSTVPTEQACVQAREVTETYTDGLGDAATPEDARGIITDAVSGLRGIDAAPPIGDRIDAVATALADLLAAVEAGEQPQALRPRAEAIGRATNALTEACGAAPEPS